VIVLRKTDFKRFLIAFFETNEVVLETGDESAGTELQGLAFG
jgi:hypothetical protein